MWFFMISSYLLSFLSFIMLGLMIVQGFAQHSLTAIPYLTFVILTSIIYFFTETLIIFFFVGTGVSVRDYSQEHQLPEVYRKTSLGIKYRVYPPTMLNLLLMILLFIAPGAVHTGQLPVNIFKVFSIICIIQYIDMKIIQHACFRDNTQNILAMAGIKREA